MTRPGTIPKWMNDHVGHDGAECLVWPFSRYPNGYGQYVEKGTHTAAHRAMCRLAHGEPPEPRFQAAHSCGNGHLGCVSPSHLSWKTPAQNAMDKVLHGTINAGERNGQAKLSNQQADEIRAQLALGRSCMSIGRQFGVSDGAIRNIKYNRSFRVAA